MSEKKSEEKFDLEEFLGGEIIARVEYKGKVTRHHFREKDSKTDLHYQRRLSKWRASRNGALLDDDALQVEIWLYDALCHKMEVEIGQELIDVPDFKSKISPDLKRHAVFAYQRRFKEIEEEETKNS